MRDLQWRNLLWCLVGGVLCAFAAVETLHALPRGGRTVVYLGPWLTLLTLCGLACMPAGVLYARRSDRLFFPLFVAPLLAYLACYAAWVCLAWYEPARLATIPVAAFWSVALPTRFLARRPATPDRCPCCRYDLTGNDSGTCPECGADAVRRCEQLERHPPKVKAAVLLIAVVLSVSAWVAALKVAPDVGAQLLRAVRCATS